MRQNLPADINRVEKGVTAKAVVLVLVAADELRGILGAAVWATAAFGTASGRPDGAGGQQLGGARVKRETSFRGCMVFSFKYINSN